MKRKLRLGLLGTGVAAERLYLPAFQKLENRIELVACSNRTRKKAERYARAAGIAHVEDSPEQLFARQDLDAVLISLPIDAQPPLVLAALAAGKAVLSEKPVAQTVAEARKLLRSRKRRSPPWMVGENFAFMPHLTRLRGWIESGRLGDIRLVEARQMTFMDRKNPYFGTPWRHAPEFVGGFVVDGGVHLAHAVRTCFGMPDEIQSLAGHFDPALPEPDTAVAILRFRSGTLGTWASCFSARYEGPMLRIFGSRANAELHWGAAVLQDARGKQTRFESGVDSFAAQFEHFADVVQKGAKLAFTPEQALDDLTLVEAIARGSRSLVADDRHGRHR